MFILVLCGFTISSRLTMTRKMRCHSSQLFNQSHSVRTPHLPVHQYCCILLPKSPFVSTYEKAEGTLVIYSQAVLSEKKKFNHRLQLILACNMT